MKQGEAAFSSVKRLFEGIRLRGFKKKCNQTLGSWRDGCLVFFPLELAETTGEKKIWKEMKHTEGHRSATFPNPTLCTVNINGSPPPPPPPTPVPSQWSAKYTQSYYCENLARNFCPVRTTAACSTLKQTWQSTFGELISITMGGCYSHFCHTFMKIICCTLSRYPLAITLHSHRYHLVLSTFGRLSQCWIFISPPPPPHPLQSLSLSLSLSPTNTDMP